MRHFDIRPPYSVGINLEPIAGKVRNRFPNKRHPDGKRQRKARLQSRAERAGRKLTSRNSSYIPALTQLQSHDLWCKCSFLSLDERNNLAFDLVAGQLDSVVERLHFFTKGHVLRSMRERRMS